jgi:hypothetical protein
MFYGQVNTRNRLSIHLHNPVHSPPVNSPLNWLIHLNPFRFSGEDAVHAIAHLTASMRNDDRESGEDIFPLMKRSSTLSL